MEDYEFAFSQRARRMRREEKAQSLKQKAKREYTFFFCVRRGGFAVSASKIPMQSIPFPGNSIIKIYSAELLYRVLLSSSHLPASFR